MKLATPEAFERDPKLVWEWYRERRQRIRAAKPNAAHEAIAKLAQESGQFLLVTQNVDDLHARAHWKGAPFPREQMVQIHGNIFVTRCASCGLREEEGEGEIPRCSRCDGVMRPGVVWFGEQLDERNIARVESFLAQGICDVTLVIGTTATFGYIVDWALRASAEKGRLLEINLDETPLSPFATETIREPAAKALPALVEMLVRSGP